MSGWLTYGNDAGRAGAASAGLPAKQIRPAWFLDVNGMVTGQPLVARNVPSRGSSTVYVGISSGELLALAPNGYVRWSADLGVLPHSCSQLPTWGLTGTPVIDSLSRALYTVDAFGWLHALDLVTGSELQDWPVRLYDDPEQELVWGALAEVDGSIYAATGSYCDEPMQGKVFRVELANRRVTSWTSVPLSLGGGGGIWGWGGVAFSRSQNALFVVTGNAFKGGSNSGARFDEAAGYGERLVELSTDLQVIGSSHPTGIPNGEDSDFVGSPVVLHPSGCDELVVAANKNGNLYAWDAADVAAGAVATVRVQTTNFAQPLLTQPAYSQASRSLYVATWSRLVRVSLDAHCNLRVAWSRPLGVSTLVGSPTVAGSVVWVAVPSRPAALIGFDAKSGARLTRQFLGGISFAAPSVIDGRLFEDARHGFAVPSAPSSQPQAARGEAEGVSSWIDARHGWESWETGVYATDDAGRHWHRLFNRPAQRVVRTSTTTGVISVGAAPSRCNCTATRLWTRDRGVTWHSTHEIGAAFAGRGDSLYWWHGTTLWRAAAWPPLGGVVRSRVAARFSRSIADVAPIPGGAAVLLTVAGKGWDNAPEVFLVGGNNRTRMVAPEAGRVIARHIHVAWPKLTIDGIKVDGPPTAITWTSVDGGATWTVVR